MSTIKLLFIGIIYSLSIFLTGYLIGSLNFGTRIEKGLYLGMSTKAYEDEIQIPLLMAFISVTKTNVTDLCNAVFLIIIVTVLAVIIVRLVASRFRH